MASDLKSVLFVCMGNICRSPTGEAVMRKVVRERGLEQTIAIDSAGTIGYHAGSPPDSRMIEHARRRGITLSGQARQVVAADLEKFDLIVAMDRENLADILLLRGADRHRAKVRLLSEFLPAGGLPDVPDPYYGGSRGFEEVLDMVEAACGTICDALVEDARLND